MPFHGALIGIAPVVYFQFGKASSLQADSSIERMVAVPQVSRMSRSFNGAQMKSSKAASPSEVCLMEHGRKIILIVMVTGACGWQPVTD